MRNPKKKDIVLGFCFLLFWIVPLLMTNLTLAKVPLLPRFITYLYSTSNLFTRATTIWPTIYIQMQFQDDGSWQTLSIEDYFNLETFGYRTRLFEFIYLATNIPDYQKVTEDVRQDLADWIAKQYVSQNASNPRPQSLRFVGGLYKPTKDNLPLGRWKRETLDSFAQSDTYIISTHELK